MSPTDSQSFANGKDEETKRTARILEVVQLIAVRPRQFRTQDLARRFEIGERMIKKDLQVIRHGLRLSLQPSKSGYYFEEIPQLPTVTYAFTEALALLQAAQVARRISGIDSADLAAAVARLESLFAADFRSLLKSLLYRPKVTVQREHRQQMLRLLNQALLEGRKLEIIYETASRDGAISSRVVHPYHIMPYVRSWQLIAYCEKRLDVIMFKVDRIHEATLLDAGYEISPDFRAEEYMGNAWGVMRGESFPPEESLLHFTPEAGRWVAEEYWHASQQVEVQKDSSVFFRLHIGITPEFVNWLLYYGSRVRVLAPEHLRYQVAEEHRQAAEQY
jgi:predicted DNA-binding transcriptional regulator YafY